MLKLICQVLGSPEYCVAVYVDADVIVTELKEAVQQKVEAIHCPAPLLQLHVLRRDNDDGDNQWLDGDDPDLDLLEMAQVPASVLEKYVKPENLMKPRRALNFYFNDANQFGSAAVHVLVQVPHGSEAKSAAECSGEVRGIEITAPLPQDQSMQSVKTATLGHVRNVLRSLAETAYSDLKIGYRVAKDATLKICIKLRSIYESVLDRVVEAFRSFYGVRTSPARVKYIE